MAPKVMKAAKMKPTTLQNAVVLPASVLDKFECHLCDWKGSKGSDARMLCKHLVNVHRFDDTALYGTALGREARKQIMDAEQTEMPEVERIFTSPGENPLCIHCNICGIDVPKVGCLRHYEKYGLHPGLEDMDALGTPDDMCNWVCTRDGYKIENHTAYSMLYETCNGLDEPRDQPRLAFSVLKGSVGAKVKTVPMHQPLARRQLATTNPFALLASSGGMVNDLDAGVGEIDIDDTSGEDGGVQTASDHNTVEQCPDLDQEVLRNQEHTPLPRG